MIFKTNYFKNKIIMKTTKDFKKFLTELTLGIFMVTTINPVPALTYANSSSDIIYPLKEVSKLECRFSEFWELNSWCKQSLPILKTKDYQKYAALDGWYNDYTRLYTVLWGSSYKYGWDVWNGWHIWTDIATSKWTPVYSIADWKVIKAKNDSMLWNYISIEHNIKWKTIVSNYAHLSKIDISVWDTVKVWKKIGEVWSTWNSTWNHLHFQIDLPSTSHPYYYEYAKCPYSYYKITEEGICIDELSKNTIDPLLFLETSWAILDKVTTTVSKNNNTSTNNNTSSNNDLSIFNRTVYVWYSVSDIKKVQEIFRELNVYRWNISWDYSDIEEDIIAYQISKWVISDRYADWAWYFWPKTRSTVKAEYLDYLANGTTSTKNEVVNDNKIETTKIDRVNLMSREEIEKKEVEDFLRYYNIQLNFINKWGNIEAWKSEIIKLTVTDKKGKAFKWEMPGWMTFIVDEAKVSVFPEKLFYFTDWKRDIQLTWKNEWNTKLYVKIWNQTIQTIDLKVFKAGQTIYPESSKVISPSKITLWEKQTWLVVFKDANWKNLINLKYGSTYKLKASWDNKVCIKEWNIKDVKKIYSVNKCDDNEYKNEVDFTYENTVWWLLIFDYKAVSKDLSFSITNTYNNSKLAEKKLVVTNPKWLTNTYAYTAEVMDLLENWIVDWINNWYFLENRWLTERDSIVWIENALNKMQWEVYDNESKQKIKSSLTEIDKFKPYSSKTKIITRQDFLNLNYKYLVLDNVNNWKVEYKDIDNETSKKLANVFDENTTWKDQFWKSYFQPDAKITRWEWAFLLSNTLEKTTQAYLTLK